VERIVVGPIAFQQASEVVIGRGLPEPLLFERPSRERVAILYSPGADAVARDVASAVGSHSLHELADREEAKTLFETEKVYEFLSEREIGRHDTIIGVGGGAATDVAGYVAATWHRGVESVLVPTTLLGAVDAAIGGKTGLNFGGKNLIGAFHLPTRVVIDLETLEALPANLQLEGIAEALKAGYIGDAGLVRLFQSGKQQLEEVVKRAVAVKADVVSRDFREGGDRALLNFGHTIGHAIEVLAPMPHGLAVAVGMVAAATISGARYGFDQRDLVETTFGLGLPVAAAGVSRAAALELIRKDKKRTSEGIRMVLLRGIADPVVEPVPEDLVDLGLASIGIA
jgi:3-dehydroquinate synthase